MKMILLAAVALTQMADVLTTKRFLALGAHEGDPLIAWTQATMGDAWVIPKLLIAGGVILIISRAKTAKPAMFLTGLGLVTVVNNALLISSLSH